MNNKELKQEVKYWNILAVILCIGMLGMFLIDLFNTDIKIDKDNIIEQEICKDVTKEKYICIDKYCERGILDLSVNGCWITEVCDEGEWGYYETPKCRYYTLKLITEQICTTQNIVCKEVCENGLIKLGSYQGDFMPCGDYKYYDILSGDDECLEVKYSLSNKERGDIILFHNSCEGNIDIKYECRDNCKNVCNIQFEMEK